jgi:hypothetical protein
MQVYDVEVVGVQAPKTARNTTLDTLRGIFESGRIAADFGDQLIRIPRKLVLQSSKSVPKDDLGIPIEWRSIEYIQTIA